MVLQRYRHGRHALGVAAVALVLATTAGCGSGPAKKPPPRQAFSMTTGAPAVQPLARSVPSRLRIPKLHIDSPIMQLGLNADRTIQVPPLDKPNLTGWWKGGPTPGEKGAAVILGHNIGNGRHSVFERLDALRPGDIVRVTRHDGTVATFKITKMEQVAKSRFPTKKVYGGLSYAGIRLITCGGRFDTSSGHHVDNIIAYGRLVSEN